MRRIELPVEDEPVLVELERGLTVFGTVRFDVDGKPAPAARVMAFRAPPGGQRIQETTSGEDGTYELSQIGETAFLLAACLDNQSTDFASRIFPNDFLRNKNS